MIDVLVALNCCAFAHTLTGLERIDVGVSTMLVIADDSMIAFDSKLILEKILSPMKIETFYFI